MSGSGTGNTPTLVGWIAAILVGVLVYALLHYKVFFLIPSAAAFGIAAALLFILLLSSSGGAAEDTDSRVRKIVPQPERVVAEPPRAVMPTRVSAAPKVEPKPIAAVESPAPIAAPIAAPVAAPAPAAPAAPVGLMAAPAAAAELAPKPKAAPAPKAAEPVAAKPGAEAKPKAAKSGAKPKAEKPAAKAKAAKTDSPGRLSVPRGVKPDDLKLLEGVGPALEKMVNSLGVYRFDQIADWSDADVEAIDALMKNFKGRIARDRWVAQAKIIVAEGLEAFRERAKTNNY